MTFAVGSLVKARGREWVVLPGSDDDMLMLRPLRGTEDEVTGVYRPLEPVEPASFDLPDPAKLGDFASCRLLRDAIRLGFRSSAGPFRSFAQLGVEPRPYQLVPLLMALKLDPVRLLIADDVGIGKTVEACLVARELLDRGEVRRMAVLCPPHLAEQWQGELRDKFHIDAALVLPSTVTRLERDCAVGQSLFDVYPHVVVSTDLIKADRRRGDFLRGCPELVIVDEAHTCAEMGVGGGGRHQRHQLLKGLAADQDRHVVLVTATPHSGKEEAFRSLLALLNPEFAEMPEDLTGKEREADLRRLAAHMVQRRRGDIRHYLDADTPFPERLEKDETYKLSAGYKANRPRAEPPCDRERAPPMKNQKETIRKVVRYLNNPEKDGGFWLPNIQRPFVWREEQIERLFDSIMREYPISTLLVWKTTAEVRRRSFIAIYKPTLKLSDFYVPDDGKPKLLVLDGQQRLQSLFIGLCGSYEGRELYLDVLSGELREPDDVKYVFQFLDPAKARPPWFKFKDVVFSERTYDDLADHLIDQFPEPPTKEDQRKVRRHVAQIVKTFQTDETIVYQELDSIDRPELYSEDDVVEVFIRANSGGTRLGKSDLLFSLLISAWDEADDQMDDLLDKLNAKGYAFSRDFVLKSCLTLLNKGARYEVEKFRDGKTRQQIEENWDRITAAILDVQDFLYGKTFVRSDKALPSYLVLIPVIYFRYHYPQKWKSVKGLESYLIRTLLSGAFSGIPDQVIDRCVARIKEDEDFVVDHIFEVIRGEGRSLEITADQLFTSGYGSDGVHLLFNLMYDFDYTPAYVNNLPQVDHIFPQSLLRKVKLLNPNTGKKDLIKYREPVRNQFANCMLLSQSENGAGGKGDTPPSAWFKDKPPADLDKHLIPRDPALWELDQFEAFIEERKRLIAEKFARLLQSTAPGR